MSPGSSQPTLRIARTDAATVRPLRQAVLRPHGSLAEVTYAADPDAVHFAAYDSAERVVGVATAFAEAHPETGEVGWRLRGMAVAEEVRGNGCGAQLLRAVLDHVIREGGRVLWCNARVGVLDFYRAHGLRVDSPEFEVPGGGPHRRMRRDFE